MLPYELSPLMFSGLSSSNDLSGSASQWAHDLKNPLEKGTGHPLAQRLGFNDFINLGLTFTAISGVLSRRVWSLNVHLEGSPCGFVAYQHHQLLNQPIHQLPTQTMNKFNT
jgi:hypothetical protein